MEEQTVEETKMQMRKGQSLGRYGSSFTLTDRPLKTNQSVSSLTLILSSSPIKLALLRLFSLASVLFLECMPMLHENA
ncbi:hypothetical protein [Rosenbergiella metrosideri]|uniref:hypothetical protein n=1 Tax=Rosenbergiella metrosideri TaxID=2921185 RepID=UPI0030C7D24C